MSPTLADIQRRVAGDIDTFLGEQIDAYPKHPTKLADAMRYALLSGGKRIRPLLAILVGEAIELPSKRLLRIGAAIECIHAYSLVHDDLPAMDDDDLRRGKPTCHVKYGEATAILVGDALQSLAYEMLSQPERMDVPSDQCLMLIRQLSVASGYQGMCGGQAIDLEATGSDSAVEHNLDTLNLLHRLKTGALLKACVTMPLVLSQISEQQIIHFNAFADAVGLAFQVRDDILDCTGDTKQIGKPAGSDNELNKHTFPALLGLDGAQQQLQNLYDQAVQALDALPYNTQLLRAFCDLMILRDH